MASYGVGWGGVGVGGKQGEPAGGHRIAGPFMQWIHERLHLIYCPVMRAALLTRGIPGVMEDPHLEGATEQQDPSQERSPRSPGGDICECCWPDGWGAGADAS